MCHHIKALQDIAQRVVQITPEIAFVFEAVSNQHKPASPSPANGAQRESASDQNGTESAAGEQRDTAKKKRTRPNRTHGSVTYESITNIDDPEAWPFAHAVLQAFPGSIKRVKKR